MKIVFEFYSEFLSFDRLAKSLNYLEWDSIFKHRYYPTGLETGRPARPGLAQQNILSGRAGQMFCRAGPARSFYLLFLFFLNFSASYRL
jgi:hypothetical protein